MKTIKRVIKSWKFILCLIVLAFILGFIGFVLYYAELVCHDVHGFTWSKTKFFYVVLESVYRTIALFAMSFNANTQKMVELHRIDILILLELARWIAVSVSGTALFRLMKPLFVRSRVNASYRAWRKKSVRTMIIGDNAANRRIQATCPPSRNALIIHDIPDSADQPVPVSAAGLYPAFDVKPELLRLVQQTMCDTGLSTTIFVNTGHEARNLELCRSLSKVISGLLASDTNAYLNCRDKSPYSAQMLEIEKRIVDKLNRLHVIVFGDQRYEQVYLQLQKESSGVLQYANPYLQSAFSFVQHHPMTESIPQSWLTNGCIDADVDLNVIFLGFGETNQNIYSLHRTVNQFITAKDQEIPGSKRVHYFIYDRDTLNDNGLNHADLRYETDFLKDIEKGRIRKEDYLPLPDPAADTDPIRMDYNSLQFYDSLKDILLKSSKSVSQIIICVGDDLENIDLGQKIAEKKKEWGINNLSIFVKVRTINARSILGKSSGVVPFGNEEQEAFDFRSILNNEVADMAKKRNFMHELEACEGNPVFRSDEDIALHADYLWYTMDTNKQLSNLYAMLGLRFKMQLMGLDYLSGPECKQSGKMIREDALVTSNEAYMEIYAHGDRPLFTRKQFKGMSLIDYPGTDTEEDFKKGILRKNLTVQEHLRWNAYMFSCGFIPASRKQMKAGCQSDYALRIHGNLTTFQGLFDYRRMMASIHASSEASEDVIRYDYQLLDEAWCFLHQNGYSIFKRAGCQCAGQDI